MERRRGCGKDGEERKEKGQPSTSRLLDLNNLNHCQNIFPIFRPHRSPSLERKEKRREIDKTRTTR